MEGVVDPLLRHIYTEIGGYDQCTTEFVRVTDKVVPDHVFYKYCPELKSDGQTEFGTPVWVQILGGRPEHMAINAKRAAALGSPGVDINFGCPAKTVNRHDGGSVILQKPERVYEISKAVVEAAAPTPVTVKIRLGYEDKSLCIENSMAAQEAGAFHLTVHARTKVEGYKPPAHWEYLAQIKEKLSIPLLANGDIWTVEDYRRCKEITGCTQFMLGRGAIANPHLALQIRAHEQGEEAPDLSWKDLLPTIHKFAKMNLEVSEKLALARVKQWTRLLSRNFPEAQEFFQKIKTYQSTTQLFEEFAN